MQDVVEFLDLCRREPKKRWELSRDALLTHWPSWNRPSVLVSLPAQLPEGRVQVTFMVSPDWAGMFDGETFLRLPAPPGVYQSVADIHGWALTVPALTDAIHAQALHKFQPSPLARARESLDTVVRHNESLERVLVTAGVQRGELVSGFQKDVVLHPNLPAGKVALYGWHRPDGRLIQPVFTGHSVSYVDYSHGWRAVSQTVLVGRDPWPYTRLLQDPVLARQLFGRVYQTTNYPAFGKS